MRYKMILLIIFDFYGVFEVMQYMEDLPWVLPLLQI